MRAKKSPSQLTTYVLAEIIRYKSENEGYKTKINKPKKYRNIPDRYFEKYPIEKDMREYVSLIEFSIEGKLFSSSVAIRYRNMLPLNARGFYDNEIKQSCKITPFFGVYAEYYAAYLFIGMFLTLFFTVVIAAKYPNVEVEVLEIGTVGIFIIYFFMKIKAYKRRKNKDISAYQTIS